MNKLHIQVFSILCAILACSCERRQESTSHDQESYSANKTSKSDNLLPQDKEKYNKMKIIRKRNPNETPEEDKIFSLENHIMQMIELDDSRISELTEEEQVIYCGGLLSAQMNINGLTNFFDYEIALQYDRIISALQVIGADEVRQKLQIAKKEVIGDKEINAQSLSKGEIKSMKARQSGNQSSPIVVALEALDDSDLDEDFHEKYHQYILNVFEAGDYELIDMP